MGFYNSYPPYVRVGDRKVKLEKQLTKLLKKNPDWEPVILESSSLANTWWGKSWNKNLERYADYGNRIGRGRSYLRMGSIFNLKISPGLIEAVVSGTDIYKVKITIAPIKKEVWNQIVKECEGNLESLKELLDGKFPKALAELFFAEDSGLFPTPKEIKFSCNCPDYAYMCKHIAATLYAIGARLDNDPILLFVLREVNIDDLITKALGENVDQLLEKADSSTQRIIVDQDIEDLFDL